MLEQPYALDQAGRAVVLKALRRHCAYRGWTLVAAHIMRFLLQLRAVNGNRGSAHVRRRIGGQRNQKARHLAGMDPLGKVGVRVRLAIQRRIHHARQDHVRRDRTILVLGRDGSNQRHQRRFTGSIDTRARRRLDSGAA